MNLIGLAMCISVQSGRGKREEGGLPREGACGTEAAGVGSLKDTHAEDTEQGQQGRRGQPGGSVCPAAHRDTSGRRRR